MYQIDNSTAAGSQPASTPDGTPGWFTDGNPLTGDPATILPAEWLNSLMMEGLNLLAAANIAPDKSQFNQWATAITTLIAASQVPPSTPSYTLSATAPTGWLIRNGQTIGDASSGATARANADTAALFAIIWALNATDYPITTSTGSASTRGANAAADFAAHKRLPLPDDRGVSIRGLGLGSSIDGDRVLGSYQDDAMQNITGTITITAANIGTTGAGVFYETDDPPSGNATDSITDPTTPIIGFDASRVVRTADENRSKNRAYTPIIKL
jgi:hypothetical protein